MDKNLHRSAFYLHRTCRTVQVFEQLTVLQFVTEFAQFHVNALHRQKFVHSKICPDLSKQGLNEF